MATNSTHRSYQNTRDLLYYNPTSQLSEDLADIYKKNIVHVGKSEKSDLSQNTNARPNTIAIAGIALGDEGKGRIVDNELENLLKKRTIEHAYVIRYQGGNNAGHTIEKGDIKLALHLIPSCVLYENASGIMDRGMVINPEDLKTEVTYVEKDAPSLKKRLFLSSDAILNTDLERAEEILNRVITGKAKGGTGRGISPSYAHHIDRLGLTMLDLMNEDWEENLSTHYKRYDKLFNAYDMKLATDISVPDFFETVTQKKAVTRLVGSKKIFLERLKEARDWLFKRKLITNTFHLHKTIYQGPSIGVVFEGAQAAGLDVWLGTRPDVTASNTRVDGVKDGTAFWRSLDIEHRVGVFKIPYTSSVGARRMPTHVDLPQSGPLQKNATVDQKWAYWVREEAHEYGTTTGRPRDITHLDLEFLRYNARMADVDSLAGTHLDTAEEGQDIKVCTHYTDKKGTILPYQPGLHYLKHVIPHYTILPGWDGKACRTAKKAKDLPVNALKFLAFIQKRTGYPIVLATTGTKREHIVSF